MYLKKSAIKQIRIFTITLLMIGLLTIFWRCSMKTSVWKLAECQLPTRWTYLVDPENTLPNYPRPMMAREQWQNLNGLWDYAIRPVSEKRPEEYDGKILVPFPVESALSGVKKQLNEREKFWYTRKFNIPEEWQTRRILLHFEAVDWETTVWINNIEMGTHRGGYDPFSYDITEIVKPGQQQQLTVAVWDPTDKGTQPRGKQVSKPHGIWYTPVTGIWQTVWLEPVPESSIRDLKIVPDIDTESVSISLTGQNIQADDEIFVDAFDEGKSVGSASGKFETELVLNILNAKLWSPETPFLYDLKISLRRKGKIIDQVQSYFGMRKIALGKDDQGITRTLLNNEFVFQNGPLDQGFWPDGIYTAPTDEALRYDLEMIKKFGFNMLRKHVKVEPRRFYTLCDQLGLLVWQDMPSGDKHIRSKDPDLVRSIESAKQFELELERMIATKFNHPSIIIWVPFNEGWGQYNTPGIVNLVKTLDSTRLVINTSGWSDRGVGDIVDMHKYPGPGAPQPEENRAAVLGEFGGLGLKVKDHTWTTENWGYQNMIDFDNLQSRYQDLYSQIWELKKNPGLSAVVYTQITDVETEANGIMTYDRQVIKIAPEQLTLIHADKCLTIPVIEVDTQSVPGTALVEMRSRKNEKIRFTLDGSEPVLTSPEYTTPLNLSQTTTIKARTGENEKLGTVRKLSVHVHLGLGKQVTYITQFSPKYPGGPNALLDGCRGTVQQITEQWQGFKADDLNIVIDLGTSQAIRRLSAGFLHDTRARIFFPKWIEMSCSEDGHKFSLLGRIENDIPLLDQAKKIKDYALEFSSRSARYLKIYAKNVERCPAGHPGAGGKAWLFIDEVIIE